MDPESEPYRQRLSLETQGQMLWAATFRQCAQRFIEVDVDASRAAARSATLSEVSDVEHYEAEFVDISAGEPEPLQPRAFKACVFCAMLHWSETLCSEYICGA